MNNQLLFSFDDSFSVPVCGIDEAGRGPLAGPVYAACVTFCKGAKPEGINDSKRLSKNKREVIFNELIKGECCSFGIGIATETEIDEYNILNATFLAMNRAFIQMKEMMIKKGIDFPEIALVDGNRDPNLPIKTVTVVKGDSKSASIAAASIIAKVSRDNYMVELSNKYPYYGFERHKGYPTKEHYENIIKYGISDVHRISFLKNLADHI